ncbi:MAG: exodeoxyribonuclease III [Deinococcota bacterium]
MRVISLNLNGYRAAVKKGLLEFLSSQHADIVCFQELKADLASLPESVMNYHTLWHPAERKGYSGVGLLLKQKPEDVHVGMGVKIYDCEGRVLRADLRGVTIVSVYVPSGSSGDPRQAFKIRFLKAFKRYLKALLAEGRKLIVCGDYNIAHQKIDLKNWQSNQKTSGFLPEERKWLDTTLKLGLRDAYREYIGPDTASYSWWSLRSGARGRNVGWRLDYQLASPELAATVAHAEIPMEPVLSDHAPVVMEYDL